MASHRPEQATGRSRCGCHHRLPVQTGTATCHVPRLGTGRKGGCCPAGARQARQQRGPRAAGCKTTHLHEGQFLWRRLWRRLFGLLHNGSSPRLAHFFHHGWASTPTRSKPRRAAVVSGGAGEAADTRQPAVVALAWPASLVAFREHFKWAPACEDKSNICLPCKKQILHNGTDVFV